MTKKGHVKIFFKDMGTYKLKITFHGTNEVTCWLNKFSYYLSYNRQ